MTSRKTKHWAKVGLVAAAVYAAFEWSKGKLPMGSSKKSGSSGTAGGGW